LHTFVFITIRSSFAVSVVDTVRGIDILCILLMTETHKKGDSKFQLLTINPLIKK